MSKRNMRDKKSENEKTKTILSKESRKAFLLSEVLLKNEDETNLVFLRHPGTNKGAYFLYKSDDKTIYHIVQFEQPNRSWFIGQSVCSNGKLYIQVPVNITFFFIYYLRKNCTERAMSMEQITDDENEYPKIREILTNCSNNEFEKISTIKSFEGVSYYKYEKNKTLAWIACLAKKLSKHLKISDDNINVSNRAISANYDNVKNEDASDADYLKYACGIVCNYISADLEKELINFLNIKDEEKSQKRKLDANENKTAKKRKSIIDEDDELITTPQKKVEKKVTAKEKALAKAASKTKSIASFFKK